MALKDGIIKTHLERGMSLVLREVGGYPFSHTVSAATDKHGPILMYQGGEYGARQIYNELAVTIHALAGKVIDLDTIHDLAHKYFQSASGKDDDK